MSEQVDSEGLLRQQLAARGITVVSIGTRDFPNETIMIVEVADGDVNAAVNIVSELEDEMSANTLVVVRGASGDVVDEKSTIRNISDSNVSRLIELLNERSRTSEQQPSLHYIKDAAENLRVA